MGAALPCRPWSCARPHRLRHHHHALRATLPPLKPPPAHQRHCNASGPRPRSHPTCHRCYTASGSAPLDPPSTHEREGVGEIEGKGVRETQRDAEGEGVSARVDQREREGKREWEGR